MLKSWSKFGDLCVLPWHSLESALVKNHPVVGIQVTLCATVEAFDAFALLPESMAVVAAMGFGVAFIDAPALDESLEIFLIGSFVD